MSLHFEVTLSMRLRPGIPLNTMEQLRFLLGHNAPVEGTPCDWPIFAVPGSGDILPGGGIATLVRENSDTNNAPEWGLFIRCVVLDDNIGDLLMDAVPWLCRWSATYGRIGSAREELALHDTYQFYTQNGYAYISDNGFPTQYIALTDDSDAPPFTAKQTCVD